VSVLVHSCISTFTCRTNPKANVRLSGKKKRLLLKETRRLVTDKSRMGKPGLHDSGGGGGGGAGVSLDLYHYCRNSIREN
jgi:hypothetical protein